jgi:general secretion pathway protein B
MSYILDALRRSQAERERGQVPGLNAQPVPALPAPLPSRRHGLVWAGVALAVLLLLALALMLARRESGAPAPATVAPAAQAPATASVLPAAPVALPVVVSAPVVPSAAPPAARVADAVAAPASAAIAAPAPAAAAETKPVPLAQLGAEQRRELPPLVISGSIWSDNPASRFVIVNGQVVREGEAAAAGVTVERIGPKAAVLRWRGLRVEVPL